jgi:hypothetical protein
MLGAGGGGSISISAIGIYDAWDHNSQEDPGFGFQGTAIPAVGWQVSYGGSKNPGADGKYAQTWQIGPGGGAETSLSFTGGYTFVLYHQPLRIKLCP